MRRFYWIPIWAAVFAWAGRIIGPGCDADAQPSALIGAVIGGFIGASGWRGVGMLVGLLVGVNIGAYCAGDIGAWLGIVAGAICGWGLVAIVIRAAKSASQPCSPESTRPA